MRNPARVPGTVTVSLLVLAMLSAVLGVAAPALADGHGAYPSQQQVDRARAHAAHKADDVAAIRHRLADANARLDDVRQRAEIASERYNGARWRLGQAKQAAAQARQEARQARQRVVDQRAGIAHLVVQSYQKGTALNSVTAVLGADGPEALMNRTGVVNMAGESLQADYERFVRLSDRADRAEKKAKKAEATKAKLATQAKADRDAAASAVASAEQISSDIRSREHDLVVALANAKHTSVALAKQRADALAEIARKKAEARARRIARAKARREAAAERRAAAEARREAAREARQADRAAHQNAGPSPSSSSAGPSSPPPSPGGVSDVIAYARAQIGKWYQWGAAGPSTFDCSGLTMMAWRQAGVSLPHYSAAQYDAGTPIPVSAAQPGDLYFWSSNGSPSGIHHVALALGGGDFIEAPHTGAQVRYNNVGNWYPDFAVRF